MTEQKSPAELAAEASSEDTRSFVRRAGSSLDRCWVVCTTSTSGWPLDLRRYGWSFAAPQLNYWRFPITNALVEGKHNRIKVLKRRGYGYRNDRSFLLRACPERSEGILNLIHTD